MVAGAGADRRRARALRVSAPGARRTRCRTGRCRSATAARPTPGGGTCRRRARRCAAATSSGSSPASSRTSRCSRFLAVALGGWLRAQLEEGTTQRRVAQGPGRDAGHVGPAGQPGPELRIPVRVGRVERERRDGSGVGVRRSILHDAEGVALRVGEHHPGHIALTDVEVSCAQPEQPLDLLGLAGPAQEVQVEPRRLGRRLGDALEAQVEHRSALDGEPRLVALRLVGQPLAADHRLPEPAQPLRLDGVEDEVLQIHAPTVKRPGSLRRARGGRGKGRCRRATGPRRPRRR